MVAVLQPEVRKFSVAEYYRLAETGVLLPSERVELLNGQIIRMAPIGEKHRTIVDKLNYVLVDKPRKRYQVSIDQPIRIACRVRAAPVNTGWKPMLQSGALKARRVFGAESRRMEPYCPGHLVSFVVYIEEKRTGKNATVYEHTIGHIRIYDANPKHDLVSESFFGRDKETPEPIYRLGRTIESGGKD